MARQVPAILCCDCVSWRLDLFEKALERIGEATRRWDRLAEIRLGYRLKDDVAFLVIEPGLLAESRIAVLAASDAGLPGLRALDLPPEGPAPEQVCDRALGSCEVVTSALAVNEAMARLRSVLGLGDDRRRTVRLSVALPLRYATPGGWVEASALDLSSTGVFVETKADPPDTGETLQMELFPASDQPIRSLATVVRRTPTGFGATLQLEAAAQEALYGRMHKLRPRTGAAGSMTRVPAHLDVALLLGDEILRETTENLSRGGTFIRTDKPLAPGAAVTLDLQLKPDAAVRLDGSVVRVNEAGAAFDVPGLGISFGPMSAGARELLDQFISDALVQPYARVLVAVASDAQRQALAGALQKRRCDVVSARTGSETFEKLVDEVLSLDLLVLDETLPGATARELLHRIRHLGGEVDLPVAVLTNTRPPDGESLLSAGATALVPPAALADVTNQCMQLVSDRRAAAAK